MLVTSLLIFRPFQAGCRVGCDLMNLFFIIDEHSDAADDKGAKIMSDIVMNAIRNPYTPRPKGEWIGGEAARQLVISSFLLVQ